MSLKFINCDRNAQFLLPPLLQEWLPERHLARFVVEIIEQLNLQKIKAAYSGQGSQPYSPEMLTALLFYGYATGVFSSRKLEASTYESVAFRYIAANRHPDHDKSCGLSRQTRLQTGRGGCAARIPRWISRQIADAAWVMFGNIPF